MPFEIDLRNSIPFSDVIINLQLDEVGLSDGIVLPAKKFLKLIPSAPRAHVVFNCSEHATDDDKILNVVL